jgi:hypothetical protein
MKSDVPVVEFAYIYKRLFSENLMNDLLKTAWPDIRYHPGIGFRSIFKHGSDQKKTQVYKVFPSLVEVNACKCAHVCLSSYMLPTELLNGF